MKLSDYDSFPSDLPIIVEDELFLYPFMISPIFLDDEENIEAANKALTDNSLIMICPAKNGQENLRDFEAIYKAGVIGTVMRKVALPDGRVKILFQGMTKGKIAIQKSLKPLVATVELLKDNTKRNPKSDAVLSVLKEKVKGLSVVSPLFPPDLLKTIEENSDIGRVCDLIASAMKLKKEQAYTLFSNGYLYHKLAMYPARTRPSP